MSNPELEAITVAQRSLPDAPGHAPRRGFEVRVLPQHQEVLMLIAKYDRRDVRDEAGVLLQWAIKHWHPEQHQRESDP